MGKKNTGHQLWTKKLDNGQTHEEYLKENYSTEKTSDIALVLNRSISSVEHKAGRMGISKAPNTFSLKERVEYRKEDLKNKEKDKLLNELINDKAKNEVVIDILRTTLPKCEYIPRELYSDKTKSSHKEIALLHLTDSHIGRYSAAQFETKIGKLYDAVLDMVTIHRSAYTIDELDIIITGDIVDGDGIYPGQAYEQKMFLMDQIFTHGLPEFINLLNKLSEHFKKIKIYCVPGNHGRKDKFTDKRLNFDTIFYEALKYATQLNKKLEWNITWDWYQYVDILGWNFLAMHGEKIKTWLNLPFYGMKEKGMRWQGALPGHFDYLMMGHFHTDLSFRWNDFTGIVTGTWMDHDVFAESELGLKSSVSQRLMGISKKHGITWQYRIKL